MLKVHEGEPLLVRFRRSVRKRRPPVAPVRWDAGEFQDGPWSDVVDLMPQLMVVVDGAGRVLRANAAARRLLADGGASLGGRSLLDFVVQQDRKKAASAWASPRARRLGWQLKLDTSGGGGLFSFDCIPMAAAGDGPFALIGRRITGWGVGYDLLTPGILQGRPSS